MIESIKKKNINNKSKEKKNYRKIFRRKNRLRGIRSIEKNSLKRKNSIEEKNFLKGFERRKNRLKRIRSKR